MILFKYRLYLVIGFFALLSWVVQNHYQQPEIETKVSENSPDFFSSGYYKKQMDSEGLPKNELVADSMQHYKADGSTHLEQPVMTLYNTNGISPWLLKAESGIMAADGDNLQLIGLTFINREASKNNKALQINTSDLQVKLASSYAQTKVYTELISPPHKTTGFGMQLTFQSPIHLVLLSKVNGRYAFK